MSLKNYKDFKTIQEVRRAKKCPILDFTPLVQSEVYQDMVGMGFLEVVKDTHSDEIITRRMEMERSFKDRLGNIGFYHPAFKGARLTRRATRTQREGYPYFNIKFDGGFRVCEGPQNTAEFPGLNQDLREKCMTIEDYIYKLSFLVKYTIKYQGFPMTSEELYSKEPYKDMILRKIEEKPSVMKGISVPPSLNNTAAGRTTSILQRFNFGKGNL
jgi:hypothetical protein